ncbi:MAG TPA: Fic family protein [Allosphingosinicella sp.]
MAPKTINGLAVAEMSNANFGRLAELVDRTSLLNAAIMQASAPASKDRSVLLEHKVAVELVTLNSQSDIFSSPKAFRSALEFINHACLGARPRWRTKDIALAPDARGVRIIFPNPHLVPKLLAEARTFGGRHIENAPFATACVLYVLLLNCHPFLDGNGRTARVLFNVLALGSRIRDGFFFPIREIAKATFGEVEICLRRAEIFGDFCPFMRLLHQADESLGQPSAAPPVGSLLS